MTAATEPASDERVLTGEAFFAEPAIGSLVSSPVISRHPANPVLTSGDVPYPSDLVMNAGVARFEGRYVMVFRNDILTGREDVPVREGVNLGLAFSDDGVRWRVTAKPCFDLHGEDIINTYDPRLTVIDGRCYMSFGMDTRHGVRGGLAVTDDFEHFEILYLSEPENRNFVLFDRTVAGKYIRLDRPFPIYGRRPAYEERFDIWLSDSPDLRYWGGHQLLLAVEHVPFANQKLGPGAPPLRTRHGWLVVFHASDYDPNRRRNGLELAWKKRYCAGVMLLDLDDPRRVIGMSKAPLLVPEADYETTGGYRNDVVFPTGAILEADGEVKIYYGAADTTVCLATASVDDLVALCTSPR